MYILSGLTTAFRTLTAFPSPGNESPVPGKSLKWFPIVGAVLGALTILLYGVLDAVAVLPGAGAQAFVLLVFLTLATRGLHIDGLADWADAFWGGYTRERCLDIMKDSNIGTFGAVAVGLLLLGKWIGLGACLSNGQPQIIVLATVMSRLVQVDLASCHSYARSGSGTGRNFIDSATVKTLLFPVVTAFVIVALFTGLQTTIWAFITAFIVGRLFGAWCKYRLKGVTGDVLGAGSELTEMILLLVLASA